MTRCLESVQPLVEEDLPMGVIRLIQVGMSDKILKLGSHEKPLSSEHSNQRVAATRVGVWTQ